MYLEYEQAHRRHHHGSSDLRWMTKLMPYLQKHGAGLPMAPLLGWIKKESDGSIAATTKYDERGYFQLMPSESTFFHLDHARLSTDDEYSVAAGIKAARYYAGRVKKLGVGESDDSFWPLVKLHHAMGMGAAGRLVQAAAAAGVDVKSWAAFETWVKANRHAVRHIVAHPLRYLRNVDEARAFGDQLWAEWQAQQAPSQPEWFYELPPQAQPASTTTGTEASDPLTNHQLRCISRLQDLGRSLTFVVRYLRDLHAAEVARIAAHNLCIVSCFERRGPPHLQYFTRAQGRIDGRLGCRQAQAAGQPAGTPIYFAFDLDPNNHHVFRRHVENYLQGVQDGYADYAAQDPNPVAYQVGVYGSGCVLDWAQAQGIATWFWQAYAHGWCNNHHVWVGANLHTYGRDTPKRCHHPPMRLGRVEGWGAEGCWSPANAAAAEWEVGAAAQPPSTTSGVEADDDMTHHIPCLQGLQDQGRAISFVQRYLRDLTNAEARALSRAGFNVVSCFETHGNHVEYFTRAQGAADGWTAFTQAHAIGQPSGAPIYFAIDTDVGPDEGKRLAAFNGRLQDYFLGVRDGYNRYAAWVRNFWGTPLAPEIGVYGSGCVLDLMRAQGIVTWFWQAFAPGWCNNAHVWVGANIRTTGLDHPLRCGEAMGHLEGWGAEGGWRIP